MTKKIIIVLLLIIIISGGYIIYSEYFREPTTKEIIQDLFAEKYELKTSKIRVSIEQAVLNHAMGKVVINKEEKNFLAVKEDEEWMLVFDGAEGFPCSVVGRYMFPNSMVPECHVGESVINRGAENGCLESGGEPILETYCQPIQNYPNTCEETFSTCEIDEFEEIDEIYEVNTCLCGPTRCFNGTKCVKKD